MINNDKPVRLRKAIELVGGIGIQLRTLTRHHVNKEKKFNKEKLNAIKHGVNGWYYVTPNEMVRYLNYVKHSKV